MVRLAFPLQIELDPSDVATLAEMRAILDAILERVNLLATQADVDALRATVDTLSAALATAVTDIRQDIADILAAHPDLDLTALQTSVSTLAGAVSGAEALDAENPAPPIV